LAELQRDPVTRGQFLTMGIVGSLVGAVLTIPPIVFVLNPTIERVFLGESDVPDDWIEVGSVWEIPSGAPKEYRVEFPQRQTYDAGQPGAVKEGDNVGSITNAVLVSWRDGKLPGILEGERGTQALSASEIEELTERLNVLSNHCAHLGCPTRWHADKGLIVCPCHGGEYDINGGYRAGPPPQGLFRFAYEIREDGGLYVKHDFTNGTPWVV
jgi:Rieske Fe-S protein